MLKRRDGHSALPARPALRAVDVQWVDYEGQPMLMLQDRIGLAPGAAFVPAPLAPLLALCDGTRDLARIGVVYTLRTGATLTPGQIETTLRQLDEAGYLEGPRAAAARHAAIADFRARPYRPLALAPHGYPDDPAGLTRLFNDFAGHADDNAVDTGTEAIRAVISPHIDYARGGPVYAKTWRRAAAAARAAELVVVLATDHMGSPGRLTPTPQHYATPFGVLPTDRRTVDALAGALDADWCFAEELHHRREHSIELVTNWLHHVRAGEPVNIVPILCGSFHEFIAGDADPAVDQRLTAAIAILRAAMANQRTLIVVSGDLAHVGPVFNSPIVYNRAGLDELARVDADLLAAIGAGDASGFLELVRADQDRHKVCGVPPIYLMLRLLGDCRGEVVAYDQCPADQTDSAWVSIGGLVIH